MKIHEYIKNHVAECIDELQCEQLFRNIRPMVAESIIEARKDAKKRGSRKIKVGDLVKKLMKNDAFKKEAIEFLKNDKEYDGWTDNLDGKTYTSLDNMSDGAKRKEVTQRLKDKKIDCAPLAYELWPDMTKDAARSYFYKKRDGKDGLSFTKEEVEVLYQLLNNRL